MASFELQGASALGTAARMTGIALVAYLFVVIVLGLYWSLQPGLFDVEARASTRAAEMGRERVTGFTTTATLIELAETLLQKPGGYMSNDVFPPVWWLDNMPNWEFGVLVQIRDLARVMRNDLSRSQSQSREDPDLGQAEGKFFFDNSAWMFPQTEHEYRDGIRHMRSYLSRLSDPTEPDAQFYERADNLRSYLAAVETRLGDLSQRLSSAAGQQQYDLGLAGESAGSQSTPAPRDQEVRTPWLEIDDVFHEARGQTWALLHILRAMEVDFRDVLEDKNALVSLRQIIRKLEATQQPMWSPMVLNGNGFGLVANHSLVMSSHIARANAALIDLRRLLSEG
ncbi:MAG: DUF2333 family protein [Pseudomonadales bacterium]|jgi:hypothetical protein|nr:DUF2333 family protein [Pseudomonadales bacterium]